VSTRGSIGGADAAANAFRCPCVGPNYLEAPYEGSGTPVLAERGVGATERCRGSLDASTDECMDGKLARRGG
jgi:hypothetical protein